MKIYQIDAFTDKIFEGNPAAVVPLENWLENEVLQAIAAENNLTETAFYIQENRGFNIRWFTPLEEVSLCGHATLAASWVIFNELGFESDEIIFQSLSGALTVTRNGDLLSMDFPEQKIKADIASKNIKNAFNIELLDYLTVGQDCFIIAQNERDIIDLNLNLSTIKSLKYRAVCISAKSEEYDFVSRFFAPKLGIDEDPVTGYAHTALAPYWSKVLNKKELVGRQLSKRGGTVLCTVKGDRVILSGKACKYLEGTINVS